MYSDVINVLHITILEFVPLPIIQFCVLVNLFLFVQDPSTITVSVRNTARVVAVKWVCDRISCYDMHDMNQIDVDLSTLAQVSHV